MQGHKCGGRVVVMQGSCMQRSCGGHAGVMHAEVVWWSCRGHACRGRVVVMQGSCMRGNVAKKYNILLILQYFDNIYLL